MTCAVTVRMDDDVKKAFEETCNDMGLTITAAFNIYAKRVALERAIPFEVTADPFYSATNMRHIDAAIERLENGHGVEHALLEE